MLAIARLAGCCICCTTHNDNKLAKEALHNTHLKVLATEAKAILASEYASLPRSQKRERLAQNDASQPCPNPQEGRAVPAPALPGESADPTTRRAHAQHMSALAPTAKKLVRILH